MELNLDYTDPEVSGNWLEACMWEGIAAVLGWRCRGLDTPLGRVGRRAAVILVPFGISDLVESQTGAWWTPWWLLAWKALGVVGLFACGVALVRLRRQEVERPRS